MIKPIFSASKTLEPHVHDLTEYVGCYFNGTKPPKMAWEFFENEQSQLQKELLAAPKVLADYLDESPHYVAAAIFGKVKLKEGPERKKILEDHTQITSDQLKAAKCLAVTPSVRPLLEGIPADKLPRILALCALAERLLKLPTRP